MTSVTFSRAYNERMIDFATVHSLIKTELPFLIQIRNCSLSASDSLILDVIIQIADISA